jgi:hypothetical protein
LTSLIESVSRERLWIQGLLAFDASEEVLDAQKSNIKRSLQPE